MSPSRPQRRRVYWRHPLPPLLLLRIEYVLVGVVGMMVVVGVGEEVGVVGLLGYVGVVTAGVVG